ncbi:UNVERIFIED_CONTAM: E3 ubiquitin-protein ligase LRSAM1 [Trichonephila clavipes]
MLINNQAIKISIWFIKKERRQQELLEMEQALKDNFPAQSSIDANSVRRKKLLDDIAQEQDRMENEIMLLQSKKDKEKKSLLGALANIENHSAKLIDQLMALNDRAKQLEKMAAVLERDRIENEEIFSIKQEKLEQLQKREILGIQSFIKIKILKFLALWLSKKGSFVESLSKYLRTQINLIEKELSNLTVAEIKKKDLKINSELNTLADHRIALASLLSDLMAAKEQREQELKERLQQMELQCAHEMEDFWLIQYQKLLDRKPKGVAAAFISKQLSYLQICLKQINNGPKRVAAEEQYQKEAFKVLQLQKDIQHQEIAHQELGVDKDVKSVLLDVPAVEYLPLFASKKISFTNLLNFTTKDFKKMGILDDDICEAILNKAQERFKNKQIQEKYSLPEFSEVPEPSAPPEEPSTPTEPEESIMPSAPPLSPDSDTKLWCQAECVICLDVQTSAVFLPCGHVCCCHDCSNKVELCPMCRTTISSRFILTVS